MHAMFDSSSMRSVIKFICLLISLIFLVTMAGCSGGKPERCDGYYVVPGGENIKFEDVTLDIVARSIYGKNFDECKNGDQKKAVIHQYLTDHADSDEMRNLVDMILELDVLDSDTPWDEVAKIEEIQETLSVGGSTLVFARVYAEAKSDKGLKTYLDKIGDANKVADFLLKSTKSVLLISDLSRTDTSHAEEYAILTVQTIKSLTDFIPYYDKYFNQSLSVVEEGLKILIEQYGDYMLWIQAHGTEIDGERGICTIKNWEILQRPQYWNDTDHEHNIQNSGQHSLSLKEINSRPEELTDMTENEENILIAYLLFRIPYELNHPEDRGLETPPEPSTPKCNHYLEAKITKKATCKEEGEKTITCAKKCGYKEIEKIEALGHDYEDAVVAPTFEAQGYTQHTCKNCGETYRDNYVDYLRLPDLSQCATWDGYGVDTGNFERRFDMTIEQVKEDYISGTLTVSILYENTHETTFEGIGSVSNGIVTYEITFATPAVLGVIPKFEYSTITLLYDPASDQFSFDGCYDAVLCHTPLEEAPALEENVTWSGLGEDSFYNGSRKDNHLFVMHVTKMNEMAISGHFTLSYNDTIDHDSEFVGRGYKKGNTIYYELRFLTPRTEKNVITITVETFWLKYHCETDTFAINSIYSVDMVRQ